MFFRIFICFAILNISLSAYAARQCGSYLSLDNNPNGLSSNLEFNFHSKEVLWPLLKRVNTKKQLLSLISQLDQQWDSFVATSKRTYIRETLYEIEQLSIPLLKDLRMIDLEGLLRFFVKKGIVNLSPKFLVEYEDAVIKKISTYKPRNLAALSYLFGRLLIQPSEDLLRVLFLRSIEVIDEFNPQNLANIIFGFANIDVKPTKRFMTAWRKQYVVLQSEFTTQNRANSLYAFYLLRSWSDVKWFIEVTDPSYWQEILKSAETRNEKSQISLVANYFAVVLKEPLKQISGFTNKFAELVRKPKTPATSIEDIVEMQIAMSGKDYEIEYKTQPGFYVDFYIPEDNKVIQVDGPSHFIKRWNGTEFIEWQRSNDLLMDEVLRAHGYRVVRRAYNNL